MNLHWLCFWAQIKQLLKYFLILAEVEQLLGPEEREILEQNVTPNLGKIATVNAEQPNIM